MVTVVCRLAAVFGLFLPTVIPTPGEADELSDLLPVLRTLRGLGCEISFGGVGPSAITRIVLPPSAKDGDLAHLARLHSLRQLTVARSEAPVEITDRGLGVLKDLKLGEEKRGHCTLLGICGLVQYGHAKNIASFPGRIRLSCHQPRQRAERSVPQRG
jgi:hypothetical protein